jgi:deazaflavin-dependent oxidoreductase (nitroreductase family)
LPIVVLLISKVGKFDAVTVPNSSERAADQDFCYLTTAGRVSGRPHTIEIWFATDDGRCLYMLAGGGARSDWVRNLMTNPAVRVRIADEEWDATARVIDADGAEQETARRLVFDKYQPRYSGDLTSWRGTALPVAVELR